MRDQRLKYMLIWLLPAGLSLCFAGRCQAEIVADAFTSEAVLLSQSDDQGAGGEQPAADDELENILSEENAKVFSEEQINEGFPGQLQDGPATSSPGLGPDRTKPADLRLMPKQSEIITKKYPGSGRGSSTILDVLDLKKMDVMDVFKLISQKSGLNIVAGQNVKGKITVYLRDVEVKEALRIIVEAYGWAFVQDDTLLKVMTAKEYEAKYGYTFGREVQTLIKRLRYVNPTDLQAALEQIKSNVGKVIADEKSQSLILIDEFNSLSEMEIIIDQMDVPVETKVFHLSYSTAEVISGKISETLTPALGTMKFDERSNKIIVSDTALKIKEISEIIEVFDQKEKEVLIEAKIVQLILSDEFKLGVDWDAVVTKYHDINITNDFDVLGATDKRGTLTIGTIADDRYTALVEALETIGETNILSAPRIMAVNNQEAKILVGSTEPYVTTTTTTPSSGPTTTAESVSFIEVGVKLYVTPTIHEDDFITMKIKPEVSSVTSNLTTSNNNTIPIVDTSEAETTVYVKDGVSIVIGGLIKEESIKTTKQIPFLGSIPILGAAFRSNNDSDTKTEIVIFLTPKIVSGDLDDSDQLVAF